MDVYVLGNSFITLSVRQIHIVNGSNSTMTIV